MKNIGKTKDGRNIFYCSECANFRATKRTHLARCRCGHSTSKKTRMPIRYAWLRQQVGYSRLIPPEDIERAKSTIYNAKRAGAVFKIDKTFAGLRVTVLSLPARTNKKDKFFL